jgi:hypothetical protein
VANHKPDYALRHSVHGTLPGNLLCDHYPVADRLETRTKDRTALPSDAMPIKENQRLTSLFFGWDSYYDLYYNFGCLDHRR